jgi:hypothetical protein
VISGRDRQVGPADASSSHAQTFERLRGRDLVDEMQIDEEEIGAVRKGAGVVDAGFGQGGQTGLFLKRTVDDVALPDLF